MSGKIFVEVKKQTELMGVCLRLSDYKNRYPFLAKDLKNYPYLDEVNEYFIKFSSHKAIQTLNEVIKLGFSYDAPYAIILYVDDDWNFHGQNNYPFVDRLKKSPLVLKFMEELKDFIKETKFEEFFAKHKNYYEEEIKNFNESMPLDDILPYMRKFFHKDFDENEFHVVLALLSTGGGYGRNDFSLKNFYCVESKRQKNGGEANKKWGINTATGRSHYLHEFCHPIVNPESDKNLDKVEKPDMPKEEYERLCASAYPSFYSIVNEYIIRGIQLCYIQDCKEDVQDFLALNERLGFNKIVLMDLAKRLNKFKDSNQKFEDEYVDIANTIAKSYNEMNKGKNYGE